MITQKDIARALGVSVSLVSRALGGKAKAIGARDGTIARIRRMASSLHYVPNAAARSLRGAAANTLGVVVFDFDDPFFNAVITAIQHRAHASGYSLVLVGFERRRVEPADLDPLLKHRPDGLIIAGSGPVGPWLRPFLRPGRPVVRIGTGKGMPGMRAVSTDHAAGVRAVVAHLTGLGHRRIAFLGTTSALPRQRYRIMAGELRRRALECRREWAVFSDACAAEAGYGVCREWVEKRRDGGVTALVASSDVVAMSALRALHEAGVRVPAEVSLTGFDDIPAARMAIPALTTVRQPVEAMVEAAFALVTRQQEAAADSARFTPELVVRESTAPPGVKTVRTASNEVRSLSRP